MRAVFGTLITACCGASLTIFIFTITAIFQNLPEIMNLLKSGWSAFLQLSYRLYQPIMEGLPALFGVKKPTGVWIFIGTTMLSSGICFVISLVFNISLSPWVIGLSFAHGIYIGLAWKRLAEPNGLHLGRRLQ